MYIYSGTATLTGQQDQFKPAYGEVAGTILGAVVRPLARHPDQGALSALWASVAPDTLDESKYPYGSFFSDPKVLGQESNEGKDQEVGRPCTPSASRSHSC